MAEVIDNLRRSLDALGATVGSDRFVLYGSYGRAALLGESIDPNKADGTPRDLDVIDTYNRLRYLYRDESAVPIDAQFTNHLRPITPRSKEWGLYTGQGDNEPAIVVDAELLGLHMAPLPFAEGYSMPIFNACGQLALLRIWDAQLGPYRKHAPQVAQLKKHTELQPARVCSCPELQRALDSYTAEYTRQLNLSASENAYRHMKRLAERIAPDTVRQLRKSPVGKFVRRYRGTTALTESRHAFCDIPELT
jgi:hypothetical protein